MNLKQFLYDIHRSGKCLLAANFYNLETLKGILQAAAQEQKPVILQASQGTIEFIGLKILVSTVRSAIEYYGVQAWLHLDHGSNLDIVQKCLDAGFDSVMIDASDKPFEQNVEITIKAVEMARPYDANVEAELGYVPKLGDEQSGFGYTEVDEAVSFVRLTGINALAIAVGTAHGFYKQEPKINYNRIKAIRKAIDVPLVLHGSSGLSDRQLQLAVEAGISKINIATEIKNAFTQTLRRELTGNRIDPRQYMPQTVDAVQNLVLHKLEIITK